MKTTNLPSLIASPELCEAAEVVRKQIEYSQTHKFYIQRAMDFRNKAKITGEYRSAQKVMSTLANKINAAKEQRK